MSVLINGMEMPTTCCYCKMIAYNPDIVWNDGGINAIGGYCCVFTGELIDNTTREEHCPLVTVQPHGRLIDADAPYLDYPKPRKPITNADRIRAMTDEELAELIGTDQRNGGCPNGGARNCQESCVKCWLDWLREEVDHVD